MWDDNDFYSDDPLVRFNAHQAAKGRDYRMPDPDVVRKAERENPKEETDDSNNG